MIKKRFQIGSFLIFVLLAFVLLFVMYTILRKTTKEVSQDYARLYAKDTSGALEAYLNREIGLMLKTARSAAVIEWLADERDIDKAAAAHYEMMRTIDLLSSDNMYAGINVSLNEYMIDEYSRADRLRPFSRLNPDYFVDDWYFETISSEPDYLLRVDIDKVLFRKLVWLDCKVVSDGIPLGVIRNGMEFSKRAAELFAAYDIDKVRGYIIDKDGVIYMDSASLESDEFLNYAANNTIGNEVDDPIFTNALNIHLAGIDSYFAPYGELAVLELSKGDYGYATIAPIGHTHWSVVTLYKTSSLFNLEQLMPLFIISFLLLIVFTIVTNIVGRRLIFRPLSLLLNSLGKLNEGEHIYGAERKDEFGELSNAIQDLFQKSYNDSLTGIYNRRFLENTLHTLMGNLSRSGSMLGVIMMDVDFFKKYNDIYGHDKGDDCLRSVSECLAKGIKRSTDFVARYGGEEFAVILPNSDKEGTLMIAEKLREDVQNLAIPHSGNHLTGYVTASFGATAATVTKTHSYLDFIKKADQALYVSKQNGRNKATYLEFES